MSQVKGKVESIRPPVKCSCQYKIFDGLVIKSRVVRLLPTGAEALCRCKKWVKVPCTYLG